MFMSTEIKVVDLGQLDVRLNIFYSICHLMLQERTFLFLTEVAMLMQRLHKHIV